MVITYEIFDCMQSSFTESLKETRKKKSSAWKRIGAQMRDKHRLLIVFSVYITAVGSVWAVVHCSVMCHNNCRLLGEVLSLTTMSTVLYGVYTHQMSVGWYRTTHSLHHNSEFGCKMMKQTGTWLCVSVAHMSLLLFCISKCDTKTAVSVE
jgi:hypothetical protein